ncbi:hypothetical protein [Salmonella phage PKM.Hi.22.6]|nr:hypothetical protein [Salmonella phage PKM.Hi.22.6]
MEFLKPKQNTTLFSSLVIGDCFEYDGDIYLKTDGVIGASKTLYNSVCLETGTIEPFKATDYVIKRPELVITDRSRIKG